MGRSSLPYIFAFAVVIIFKLVFIYLEYRRAAKRYVKKFKKTLIKSGIPRREAKELTGELDIPDIKDLLRNTSLKKQMLFFR